MIETLGEHIPFLLPQARRTVPHTLLDGLEIADLARVAADRLKLQIQVSVISTTRPGRSHWTTQGRGTQGDRRKATAR